MSGLGNVYVVDDEPIIRRSISLLLNEAGYFCRPFATGGDLIEALDYLGPGCVLLDINMPEMSGLDVQDRLNDCRSDMAVIFMTAVGDIPMAVRAIKKGAMNFIEKPFADERLLEMIAEAQSKLAERVRSASRSNEAVNRLAKLTPREMDVMRGLLRHGSNKSVAYGLQLSPRTVEMHRANIMKKVGARNFATVVQLALDAGLMPAVDHSAPR
jgi:two-component system, LuxR family, response regulator FixJ